MFAVYMYKNIVMLNLYPMFAVYMYKTIGLNPLSPQWSRQAVDTGGKILSNSFILFRFFIDTDPHLASVVCVLYLFSVSRYELCVCGNLCRRAYERKFGVATNHGKF